MHLPALDKCVDFTGKKYFGWVCSHSVHPSMDQRHENPMAWGRVSMHSNCSSSIVDTVAVAVCGLALSWRRHSHRQQPAPFLANSWLQIFPQKVWVGGTGHSASSGHVVFWDWPVLIPEESQHDLACRSLHPHLLRFGGQGVAPLHALLLSFWFVEVYQTLIPSDDTLQKRFTVSVIPTQKPLACIDTSLFHFRCQLLGYPSCTHFS